MSRARRRIDKGQNKLGFSAAFLEDPDETEGRYFGWLLSLQPLKSRVSRPQMPHKILFTKSSQYDSTPPPPFQDDHQNAKCELANDHSSLEKSGRRNHSGNRTH
jgi:hypothetical protein